MKRDVHFTVYTCDRCDREEEGEDKGKHWAVARAQGYGAMPLYGVKYEVDLCPGCACALMVWFEEGRAE